MREFDEAKAESAVREVMSAASDWVRAYSARNYPDAARMSMATENSIRRALGLRLKWTQPEQDREDIAKIIEAQPQESFCTIQHQGQTRAQRAVYAAAVRAGRVLDLKEALAVVQALPGKEGGNQ